MSDISYSDAFPSKVYDFAVKVLFNEKYCYIPLLKYDSVGVLKSRVLELHNIFDNDIFYYYDVFLVRWSDSTNERTTKKLYDHSIALELIYREENSWIGHIDIFVAPMQLPINDVVLDSVLRKNSQTDDIVIENQWIIHFTGFTEAISPPSLLIQSDEVLCNNSGLLAMTSNRNINERIFNLISNSCLKQGVLHRRTILNGSEQWREQYYMLTPKTIWFYSLVPTKNLDNEKRLYSIPLDSATSANLFQGSPNKFVLESDSFDHPVVLSSKYNEESIQDSWIECINNRTLYESTTLDENSSIIAAETMITDHEVKLSSHEMRSLCNLDNLHGILINQRLRGALKSALYNQQQDDLLRFWEVAEDFRMNHGSKDDEMRRIRATTISDLYIACNANSSIINSKTLNEAWNMNDSIKNDLQSNQILNYSDPELFANYHQLVSEQLGAICEELFFKSDSDKGRKSLQLALLPLDRAIRVEPAFVINDNSEPPQASLPSTKITNTIVPDNNTSKRFPYPGYHIRNLIRNISIRKPVYEEVNSSTDKQFPSPTRRSSENSNEIEFNNWMKRINSSQSNSTTSRIASRAPESWWNSLKSYLKLDPERYERFTFRNPAPWLPYDSRPIIEEICSKALPLMTISTDSLMSTLGFGSISHLGFMDLRYVPLSFPSQTASSSSTSPLTSTVITSRIRSSTDLSPGPLTRGVSMSIDRSGHGSSVPNTPLTVSTHDYSLLGGLTPQRDTKISSETLSYYHEWRKAFIILGEWQGHGRLYIFDHLTWYLQAKIHLINSSKMEINVYDTSVIDLLDNAHNKWQLRVEPVNDRDGYDRTCGKIGVKYWMNSISRFCPGTALVESVVFKGQMSKRGKVNTAFKRRWFILIADSLSRYKLRYYTNEYSGLKGEIPLSVVKSIQCSASLNDALSLKSSGFKASNTDSPTGRLLGLPLHIGGGQDINKIFQVVAVGRTWELMANSIPEALEWIRHLRDALIVASLRSDKSEERSLSIDDDEYPEIDDQ